MVVDEEQEVEEEQAGDGAGLEAGGSQPNEAPELRLGIRRRDARPGRARAPGSA